MCGVVRECLWQGVGIVEAGVAATLWPPCTGAHFIGEEAGREGRQSGVWGEIPIMWADAANDTFKLL